MIWGDGTQTRSFTYIDDCVKGIDMIMHCDDLAGTPINLGSSELITIMIWSAWLRKLRGQTRTPIRSQRSTRRC